MLRWNNYLIAILLMVSPLVSANLLGHSRQLLVVTTPNWKAVDGVLQRYARNSQSAPWHKIGKAIPIVVGAGGIGRIKKEGDKRTPTGVYALGPAFGFAAYGKHLTQLNYLPLKPSTLCVDDAHSRYYNKLIDSDKIKHQDWHSAEQMRAVPVYKFGSVIQYNMQQPIKGAGSCIFLHIWRGKHQGTAGCVAMSAYDLKKILRWLDAKQNPTIILRLETVRLDILPLQQLS